MRIGTIEAIFRTTQIVSKHSDSHLMINEEVHMPNNITRCTFCEGVGDVQRCVVSAWLMAVLLFNKEDRINI